MRLKKRLRSWWHSLTLLLPKQWLAALFCRSLAANVAILAVGTRSSENRLCAVSDGSIAVCARAWAAPLAGLSSFVVALIALLYSMRSFKVSHGNQVIEDIKRRVEVLSRLHGVVRAIHDAYYNTVGHVIHIEFMIQHNSGDAEIKKYAEQVMLAWNELDQARKSLTEFSFDQVVDEDLVDLACKLSQYTYIRGPHSTRFLAEAIERLHQTEMLAWAAPLVRTAFVRNYDAFQQTKDSVLTEIKTAAGQIEEAARILRKRRQEILGPN